MAVQIGHLPWTPGWAILAASLLLRQDMDVPPQVREVAFVGSRAESDDASFRFFRASIGRMRLPPGLHIRLRYYEGADFNRHRLAAGIDAALASQASVLVVPTADAAALATSRPRNASVVFASRLDPLRIGVVKSLRYPGGRTTGVSLADNLHLKRLELLKDAFPGIRRVAVLADTSWLPDCNMAALMEAASAELALRLVLHVADTPEDLDRLMRAVAPGDADAWYIPPTYVAYLAERQLIEHLRRLRRPAMHATDEEVAHGALMAYSQDTRFAYDALAELAVRVALGEDAGEIPVQRPRRYLLSVRVSPAEPWARVDPAIVRRADRVH